MNNINDIKAALIDAQPGTRFAVKDYHDSNGETYSTTFELLSSTAYQDMLKEDLRLLQLSDEGDLFEIAEDLPMTDFLAARAQLIETKSASLARYESGTAESAYKGAQYESIGEGSLATLPGKDESLYVLRLKVVGDVPPVKPAKGGIPRAKQLLAKGLDLPTRRYVHAIGLVNGKFSSVELVGESVAPA